MHYIYLLNIFVINCIFLCRFIHVQARHTSQVLCDVLLRCLMDLNLERKLSALTVDNCTTNDRMIQLLLDKLDKNDLLMGGKLFHMRCTAHILNLIVKEGLSVISEGVAKIRASVAFWTVTPQRREKIKEISRRLNIPCSKELVLDCITRWNSTYLMISVVLEYKNVFYRLHQLEAQYRCLPSESEWELARILSNNLKSFYNVTEVFSGTKYPTSNLFFIHICEIRLSLGSWLTCEHDEVRQMAINMIGKFEKYWKDVNGVLTVATVLDPRYKMKLIEFYFPLLYGDESNIHIERVQMLFKELIKEYEFKAKLSVSGPSVGAFSSSIGESSVVMSHVEEQLSSRYDDFLKANMVENRKTELESYLGEYVLITKDKNFDILGWWKINAIQYPLLSTIARDILAIPVSTVAFESAFSTCGRVVSPHRNRLHSQTVEALMCTQSWLNAYTRGNLFYCNLCIF